MELKNYSNEESNEAVELMQEEEAEVNSKLQPVWYLECLSPEGESDFFIQLKKFPFSIGRNVDCELLLPFKSVSRYHAQIVNGEGLLHIIDLESVNGVYVNQKKIEKSELLKNGDTIHFSKLFDQNVSFRVVTKNSLETAQVQKNRVQTHNDSIESRNTKKSKKYSFIKRTHLIEGRDCDFKVGLPLNLETKTSDQKFIRTRIFSWKTGIFLTLDIIEEEHVTINEGIRCAARFSCDSKVFGFLTTIQQIETSPTHQITVIYPKKVSYISYRKNRRYKTNLKSTIRKSPKYGLIDCNVIDLSLTGLQVLFHPDLKGKLDGEFLLTLVDTISYIRVKKVHEFMTDSVLHVGFQILSFGGLAKKKKYEEVLDFHAPLGSVVCKQSK